MIQIRPKKLDNFRIKHSRFTSEYTTDVRDFVLEIYPKHLQTFQNP